jgi:hypothetical protein
MKKINFIHCIENKENHNFESEAKLYLKTFFNLSPLLFKNVQINFLQPTANDIKKETIEFFSTLKINFIREPSLSSKQINQTTNYTNVCVTCDYFSKKLNCEYICWTDLDIVFTNEAGSDFFKSTKKIVLTIHKIDDVFSAINEVNKIDKLYKIYFKKYIDKKFYVDKITNYTNTWFLYGPTKHPFWYNWKLLTYHLLDIIHIHHQKEISSDLESCCEEIASSLLYTKYSEWFTDIQSFFDGKLAFTENSIDHKVQNLQCNIDTTLYHYNTPIAFQLNNFEKFFYKKEVFKILMTNFKEHELTKWGFEFKNILSIYKKN